MAHLHHCLVTQKLQSTYFNVLYAYFIIGRKIALNVLWLVHIAPVYKCSAFFGDFAVQDKSLYRTVKKCGQ